MKISGQKLKKGGAGTLKKKFLFISTKKSGLECSEPLLLEVFEIMLEEHLLGVT